MTIRKNLVVVLIAVMSAISVNSVAARADPTNNWLEALVLSVEEPPPPAPTATAAAPPRRLPPLPPHNLEGVGGGLITPMAYLCNPGREGTVVALPTVSLSYIHLGHKKNVQIFSITQTFCCRFEIGYSLSRFGLGNLPHDLTKATGFRIGRDDVYLHNFNFRALLLPENSFDLPLPAITAGAHFKFNSSIRSIDNRTAGAFGSIGMARSNATDFTLTATKTVPLFERPTMFTVGVRNGQGAQIGYLGFSDSCETTVEASVVCLLTDSLALGYEFRQKLNPYDKIPGLIEDEDSWHSVVVGVILGENLTLSAGWACLGNMANTDGSGAWGVQLRYEF